MRLTALWWWIDRWRKSTAYTDMTLEEQGAYRNLLDEAHLRGGYLPDNERILAKSCGDALAWKRVRRSVLAKFTKTPHGLHNETLGLVMTESKRRAKKQADYRERQSNDAGNATGNDISNQVQPPVPVPVLKISDSKVQANSEVGGSTTAAVPASTPTKITARSKRPIFTGQRLTVFEWQLDDLMRLLGPHTDAFDLHEWFFTLDAASAKSSDIIPQRDGGKWLQIKTIAEAQRRGLKLSSALPPITAANLAAGERWLQRGSK